MKKISIILAVFALAMTMSQCKKNEGQTNSNDEVVTITLDVKNNDSSKVVVNTTTGSVDFETGDKIYVGSGGKYVGYLTHNGTNFSGNITNPMENQPLQFYFLGNVTPQETLSAGTTEECSVVISDQTEHLPVISCAASNENYVSGVTAYSAHLLNKCVLVKFNVTTPSNSPICITGMKNKVTVDFTQNTMTPSKDGEGVIMLPAGSGENVEKWAILLPQEALEEGGEGSAYSEDGVYSGIRPMIPAVTENEYLADGITMTVIVDNVPVGAINGLYTINENGDQVYFSQGNLQYIGNVSLPYWKFADNQWDYFGDNGQTSVNVHVNRDLFGWGTSGWDCSNTNFEPWNVIYKRINNQLEIFDESWKYGPTGDSDLTGDYANSDWGIYNAIKNGGNQNGIWRTLSEEEWDYVFNSRITSSGIRYAKANVNNVNGVILLPDDWNCSVYQLYENYNESWAEYSSNIIDISQWNLIQEAGAVFLPAAGMRINNASQSYGGNVTVRIDLLNNSGKYWSTKSYYNVGPYSVIAAGYNLFFSNNDCSSGDMSSRGCGLAVRLVQDYNP